MYIQLTGFIEIPTALELRAGSNAFNVTIRQTHFSLLVNSVPPAGPKQIYKYMYKFQRAAGQQRTALMLTLMCLSQSMWERCGKQTKKCRKD